jgi:hypothetical protein
LKKPFQQPVQAVQDAPPFFKPLKNGEKQKSDFLLFVLKKSMDGLFQHHCQVSIALFLFRATACRLATKTTLWDNRVLASIVSHE